MSNMETERRMFCSYHDSRWFQIRRDRRTKDCVPFLHNDGAFYDSYEAATAEDYNLHRAKSGMPIPSRPLISPHLDASGRQHFDRLNKEMDRKEEMRKETLRRDAVRQAKKVLGIPDDLGVGSVLVVEVRNATYRR